MIRRGWLRLLAVCVCVYTGHWLERIRAVLALAHVWRVRPIRKRPGRAQKHIMRAGA